MRKRLPHLLAFLLALAIPIAIAVLQSSWLNWPGVPAPAPSRLAARFTCERDPANLPHPPPGPDGQPANYLHTCGNRIYDSQGREVKIAGINWFGMETGDHAPGGLSDRNWQDILDQIAALGYNTVRLPFSNQALEAGATIRNVNYRVNPDLEGLNGLQMLDRLVQGARDRGLRVILDRHRTTPGSQAELWYDDAVPEGRWISDWRMLASRYAGNDTVIAVDLSNEPRGAASWGTGDQATDWRLAAERSGNAVLDVNPYLLVFVEGVERYNGERFWWGGDLQGVRTAPVRLRVPGRLVYSPHDYGPSISGQTWFWDPRFPANLPEEWDRRWGYIHKQGIAPIVVGEFGGRSFGDDADGLWQKTLLAYLKQNEMGAIVWSLNPNWDTGGVLNPDWRSVDEAKQQAYSQLLAPPLSLGTLGIFGRAPARWQVLFRQQEVRPEATDVSFAFRISNQGPDPVDLSRLEIRYWLRAGSLTATQRQAAVQEAEIGMQGLSVDLVAAAQGGQDHYLRIRFGPQAGSVGRYGTTDPISLRLRYLDWPGHTQADDYSFAGPPAEPDRYAEWDRVTVYLDGKLVWGREP